MTATNQNPHFNLHLSGVGYLNRIRWVEPRGRKADRFLACSVSALRGNADQPDYTYLDLRVSGSEAIEMIDKLQADVAARHKVFIAFRVGDIYPHAYERDVRNRDGQATGEREMAQLIKGRLLLINSITIDGEQVFRRESNDAAAQSVSDGAAQATPKNTPEAPRQEPQAQPEEKPQAPVAQAAPRVVPQAPARPRQQVDERSYFSRGGHQASRQTGGEVAVEVHEQRPSAYQRAHGAGRFVRRGAERVSRAMS